METATVGQVFMIEPLTILMTTYAPAGGIGKATEAAAQYAMGQWNERILYPGELRLHVADDGSTLLGYGLNASSPPGCWWERGPVTFSRQERHGIGASLNAGLQEAFRYSPLAVLLMDDWGLMWTFNMKPWATLLLRHSDVGLVRLGPPHPNIRGQVGMFEDGWFLRLERSGVFTSLRPWMIHERFMTAYGPFDENASVGECERMWNMRVAAATGPDIVLALPTAWEWIYAMDGYQPRPSLAGVDPQEEQSFATYKCAIGHIFDWRTHDGMLKTCQWVVDPTLDYFSSLCGALVERV